MRGRFLGTMGKRVDSDMNLFLFLVTFVIFILYNYGCSAQNALLLENRMQKTDKRYILGVIARSDPPRRDRDVAIRFPCANSHIFKKKRSSEIAARQFYAQNSFAFAFLYW